MQSKLILPLLLGLTATDIVVPAQQTACRLKYHTNDIVNIHAKMRYTTMIELPATEKILEVATGIKYQINNHYLEIFGTSIALGIIAGAAESTNANAGYNISGPEAYKAGIASMPFAIKR